MASCFKNPNKKYLSAKDYTIKKRRNIIFCDLREKMLDKISRGDNTPGGSNDACIDENGVFTKYKNHKIQLDMLAAFEDFRSDLLTTIPGQIFKDYFCSPYYINPDNTGIKNNYYSDNIQLAYGEGAGYGHLTDYFGALNKSIVSLSSESYKNKYAEIKPVDSDLGGDLLGGFQNNKFLLEKPPICNNLTRPQVFKPGDLSAPELSGIELIIEPS